MTKKTRFLEKEKQLRKKNRLLRKSFNLLVESLRLLSFDRMINSRVAEMKARPPKTKRWFERLHQISYKKEVNHYTIKLHTSWSDTHNRFNVTGKLWVVVTAAVPGVGEEVKLIRHFKRIPGFENNVSLFLTALDAELKNRPSDKKGSFMELVQISNRCSVWRSVQYKKNKEEKQMFVNLPGETDLDKSVKSFIKKKQHEWNYYQEVLRDRRGVVQYESDIRKPWDIEFPENAVPVR